MTTEFKLLEIRHECVAILSLIDGHQRPNQPAFISPPQSNIGRNVAFLWLTSFEGRGSNGGYHVTSPHHTYRLDTEP